MDELLPDLLKAEGGDDSGTLPVPPVDEESCALLGPTALVVQGLMAILVLSTLLLKRYKENPRREWSVWLGDVSKQVIGQGFLHSSNILISSLFQYHRTQNACTAYFLSIFIDCTLGVLIIFSVLRILSWLLIEKMHLPGFKSGRYYYYSRSARRPSQQSIDGESLHGDLERDLEDNYSIHSDADAVEADDTKAHSQSGRTGRSPFQFLWWLRQLGVYLVTLTIMKALILGFFWIPLIFDIGDWLLSWLKKDIKIIFVLMIFPLLMNAFQFLIIDTILKSSAPKSDLSASIERSASRNTSRRNSRDDGRNGGNGDEENQAFLSAEQYDNDAHDEGVNPVLPPYDHSRKIRSNEHLSTRSNDEGYSVDTQAAYNTDSKLDTQGQASPIYPPPPPRPNSFRSHSSTYCSKERDSFSFTDEEEEINDSEKDHALSSSFSKFQKRNPDDQVERVDIHLAPPKNPTPISRTVEPLKLPHMHSQPQGMLRTGSNTSNQSDRSDNPEAGWGWLDKDDQQGEPAHISR